MLQEGGWVRDAGTRLGETGCKGGMSDSLSARDASASMQRSLSVTSHPETPQRRRALTRMGDDCAHRASSTNPPQPLTCARTRAPRRSSASAPSSSRIAPFTRRRRGGDFQHPQYTTHCLPPRSPARALRRPWSRPRPLPGRRRRRSRCALSPRRPSPTPASPMISVFAGTLCGGLLTAAPHASRRTRPASAHSPRVACPLFARHRDGFRTHRPSPHALTTPQASSLGLSTLYALPGALVAAGARGAAAFDQQTLEELAVYPPQRTHLWDLSRPHSRAAYRSLASQGRAAHAPR